MKIILYMTVLAGASSLKVDHEEQNGAVPLGGLAGMSERDPKAYDFTMSLLRRFFTENGVAIVPTQTQSYFD
jgi:hypothetical protein